VPIAFIREPQPAAITEYHTLLEKAVAVFGQLPGLQAICQYGSIGNPGISDLDLLLVYEDDAPPSVESWHKRFTERERYLFLHAPAAISNSLFTKITRLTTFPDPQCLAGSVPAIQNPGKSTAGAIAILSALDHSLRLAVAIENQLAIGVIKQRPALCELHSIRHDLGLAGLRDNGAGQRLVAGIEQLRAGWFERDRTERRRQLADLLVQASTVERHILSAITDWAQTSWTGKTPPPAESLQSNLPGISFESSPGALEIQASRLTRWGVSELPGSRLRQIFHSRFGGLTVRLPAPLIAVLAGPPTFLKPDLAETIQSRRELAQRYRSFVERLGGGFGTLQLPPLQAADRR